MVQSTEVEKPCFTSTASDMDSVFIVHQISLKSFWASFLKSSRGSIEPNF